MPRAWRSRVPPPHSPQRPLCAAAALKLTETLHARRLPVDMLSPGDTPSSAGCSADCGLEAARPTAGGSGGGRVGLCRGFGVGRDLLRAPTKPEGEASGGAAAAGESWPEAREYPGGQLSP